jgi:putative inorganic carbon (HCO3(-)) transporter
MNLARESVTARSPATGSALSPEGYIQYTLLSLYILVPSYAPPLATLDTTTAKFLGVALLNLVAFLFVIRKRNATRQGLSFLEVFRSWPGVALLGLIVMTALSMVVAINVTETLLEVARLFNIVLATALVAVLVSMDLRSVKFLMTVLAALLIVEGLVLSSLVSQSFRGGLTSVGDFKWVYSNKNIYAAAIYIKMAAALYLIFFESSKLRVLGFFALFFAFYAIIVLFARAFYLGIGLSLLMVAAHVAYAWIRDRSRSEVRAFGLYFGVLVLALGVNWGVESLRSASVDARPLTAVADRLGTIASTSDASNRARLDSWGWTLRLIKDNPLLGVGAGNWRVAVLEYENQKNPEYSYLYRAHNDFLEVTADRGILGGLFFLGIFAGVLVPALRSYRRPRVRGDVHPALVVSAVGATFYMVDAFFNFPGDRAEIMGLLALFVGISIAASSAQSKPRPDGVASGSVRRDTPVARLRLGVMHGAVVILILSSAYLLYVAMQSSRFQQVLYGEISAGKLTTDATVVVESFPWFPALSHFGEPIRVLKARYLLKEERIEDAIEVLYAETHHPFDGRREAFLAEAYQRLGVPDRALDFANQALDIKPNSFAVLNIKLAILEEAGDIYEIIQELDSFIERRSDSKDAWIAIVNAHLKSGSFELAHERAIEAMERFPGDDDILRQLEVVRSALARREAAPLYARGRDAYRAGQFAQAVPLFTQYLEKVPDDTETIALRAMALYMIRDFVRSIADIDHLQALGGADAQLINLRGAGYQGLGDLERACEDFRVARGMGDEQAQRNVELFCRGAGL